MQTTAENSTFTVNLTIYVAVKVLCFSLAIAEFQTIAKKMLSVFNLLCGVPNVCVYQNNKKLELSLDVIHSPTNVLDKAGTMVRWVLHIA